MKYLDENGLLYLVQKIKSWLNGKSDTGHTHTKSEITDYTEYQLPTASADTLGGIKVGSGLAINNGVLSATGGGTADSVDWSNVQNKPTKLSEFTNDQNFQTDTQVETAITSKGYQTASDVSLAISSAIADIQGISYSIVTSLPETGEAGVIYLISNSGANPNSYDEYIWITNKFEKIGTTDVDLSGYVQDSDLVAITNAEIDTICA